MSRRTPLWLWACFVGGFVIAIVGGILARVVDQPVVGGPLVALGVLMIAAFAVLRGRVGPPR